MAMATGKNSTSTGKKSCVCGLLFTSQILLFSLFLNQLLNKSSTMLLILGPIIFLL